MKRHNQGKKPGDPALAPYPGLTIERGVYYVRHPITKRKASLGTKDFHEAVTHYLLHKKQWADQVQDLIADKIVSKMLALSNKTVTIKHREAQGTTLAQYARYIRTDWLGYKFDDKGKVVKPIVPRLLSNTKISKRKGKPISVRTATDYGQMIRYRIEEAEGLAFGLATPRDQSVLYLRSFLSQWISQAPYYNNMIACLSKVYQQAIREGLCTTNPMNDIDALPTSGRRVYVPDEAYLQITGQMMKDRRFNRETQEWEDYDSEWEARAVDMLYLVSGRPEDTLRFPDAAFVITDGPGGRLGTLRYETGKTGQLLEIALNDAVMDLVQWFRDWKQKQGILSTLLICYPTYFRRDYIGQPVSVKYLSGRWGESAVKAGFEPGQYWMYDTRKKSITDENRKQGKNNKGGHRTDAMREHYILDEVPMRSRATLAALPRKG